MQNVNMHYDDTRKGKMKVGDGTDWAREREMNAAGDGNSWGGGDVARVAACSRGDVRVIVPGWSGGISRAARCLVAKPALAVTR